MTTETMSVEELDELAEWAKDEGKSIYVATDLIRRLVALARRSLGEANCRSIAPWQPIGTAPKDGTPLLGYARGYPDESKFTMEVMAVIDGEWITDAGTIYWPTHWLPLPPPPSMATEPEHTEATNRATNESIMALNGMEAIAQLREGVIARYPTILARLADTPPPDAHASGELSELQDDAYAPGGPKSGHAKPLHSALADVADNLRNLSYPGQTDSRIQMFLRLHNEGFFDKAAAMLEAKERDIERCNDRVEWYGQAYPDAIARLSEKERDIHSQQAVINLQQERLISLRETVERYRAALEKIAERGNNIACAAIKQKNEE